MFMADYNEKNKLHGSGAPVRNLNFVNGSGSYKEMYKTLFNAVTRSVDILQRAQREAEEIYISSGEGFHKLLKHEDDKSE